MAIVKWSPWRDLDAMERRMRRMFDDIGVAPAPLPAADVYETDDEYVVELEVPGFDEDKLTVEVKDRTLIIAGERTEETEETDEKDKTFFRHERLETSFERRFALPPEIDAEGMRASFSKGVLEVKAAKLAEAAPRKVEIAIQ